MAVEVSADDNSLENRLKAFNAPEIAAQVDEKASAIKPEVKTVTKSKSKSKTRLSKRRYKRACYKSSAATLRERAESFQPYIRNASRRYGVSEALIISVITAESCFAGNARSPMNAQGLMQLIPATAKRFGVKNAYVPSQNIKGGTRYLKFLLERFAGNLHLAVAGYNAGEGAVDRYSGIPPYKETKEYVRRVMAVYKRLQNPSDSVAPFNQAKSYAVASSRSKRPVRNTRRGSTRSYFIKPDYKWKRKKGRARTSNLYKVSTSRKGSVCRDVSSRKLKRNSQLVKRSNSMKRYYSSQQPKSLSSIARATGVSLNLLLRMNRGVSRYMVKAGSKVLVWQCAKK